MRVRVGAIGESTCAPLGFDGRRAVLLLALLQACIPSFVLTVLFRYPVLEPVPLAFLLLAGMRAWAQVALRTAFLVASGIGALHEWNITVYTLPFYLRFVTLDTLPWSPLQIAGALACLVAFAWPLPPLVARTRWALAAALLGIAIALGKGVPAAHGVPGVGPRIKAHVRSPALRTGYDFADASLALARELADDGTAIAAPPERPGRTFAGAITTLAPVPDKLLLVVLESWSESAVTFAEVQHALARQGVHVRDAGYTEFRGSTLPGELRELCATFVSLGSFRPGGPETRGCLPGRLRAAGWRTFAVHGYVPGFYLRDAVWRDLGFERRTFGPALPAAPRCEGPFTGVCDSAAIAFALDELERPGRAFGYVLTLSSHEPVRAPAADVPCTWFAGVPEAVVTQRVARQSLCHLARALELRTALHDVYVYVVGDHAPPSIAHSGLVPPGVVPYLVIAPRAISSRSGAAPLRPQPRSPPDRRGSDGRANSAARRGRTRSARRSGC